jgi:hypothetical protein
MLAALSQPRAFHSLLSTLRNKEWVVYSKPPFGGPEHVLKYLARYTHRVAISNGRLLGLDSGQVRFRWRDFRHNNRSSIMKLDAVEFIRRFLVHTLPAGFMKISTPPPRTSAPADRTAEVRTEPILSPVQKRHPARGRKTAT